MIGQTLIIYRPNKPIGCRGFDLIGEATADSNTMHAVLDLLMVLKLMIYRSGSVIEDAIWLGKECDSTSQFARHC